MHLNTTPVQLGSTNCIAEKFWCYQEQGNTRSNTNWKKEKKTFRSGQDPNLRHGVQNFLLQSLKIFVIESRNVWIYGLCLTINTNQEVYPTGVSLGALVGGLLISAVGGSSAFFYIGVFDIVFTIIFSFVQYLMYTRSVAGKVKKSWYEEGDSVTMKIRVWKSVDGEDGLQTAWIVVELEWIRWW